MKKILTLAAALFAAAAMAEEAASPKYVLFVTASERVGTNVLAKAGAILTDMFKVPIRSEARKIEDCAMKSAKAMLTDSNALAVVVVQDSAEAPSMMVVPESRFAVVNTLAYSPEGTDAKVLEVRALKQVERAFCAVLGGGFAPVFSAEDLDGFNGGVAPNAFMAVPKYLRSMGFIRRLGDRPARTRPRNPNAKPAATPNKAVTAGEVIPDEPEAPAAK